MSIFSAIQITTTENYQENINKAFSFIEKSADDGAKFVSLPETFTYIGISEDSIAEYKEELTNDFVKRLGNLAKEKNIYLLAGSIPEKIENSEKLYNTSILFSPKGEILHHYRKIHLFDICISNSTVSKESDRFESGDANNLKVIETPYGKIGFTICYDLRFSELYRKLTFLGAEIILVPSAFTLQTGKDHWEILLRARAIENQVYIVAPNQFGRHNKKRTSYGNSMIVDPWGKVIARASDKECIIYGDIDIDYLRKVRKDIPCLEHTKKSLFIA